MGVEAFLGGIKDEWKRDVTRTETVLGITGGVAASMVLEVQRFGTINAADEARESLGSLQATKTWIGEERQELQDEAPDVRVPINQFLDARLQHTEAAIRQEQAIIDQAPERAVHAVELIGLAMGGLVVTVGIMRTGSRLWHNRIKPYFAKNEQQDNDAAAIKVTAIK